uniref:NAC domain-containing protein n=1 Tax=Oryza brachyantha TaxID=4533 RepID=J3NDC9_ORYBR
MEAKECAARRALPPGFRFRPTDEELVVHYLRRRALDTPLPPAIDIPDVRLLAHDPSDLLPPAVRGGGAVTAGVRFIDFFARADARGRRPASPVSSSCVTDASAEHCREQETTSRGASD